MKKNYDGKVPELTEMKESGTKVKLDCELLIKKVRKKIDLMQINEAIEDIMRFVRIVNKFLEINAPWKMVKVDKINAGNILYIAGESLRIIALLLSPIMPSRTAILLEAFNAKETALIWGELRSGSLIKNHTPLFPRLK